MKIYKQFRTILVSAYACEPKKGSEPSVGWTHVINLSKQYEIVHVVTRKNNEPSISNFLKKNPINNLFFHYHDLPIFFIKLKKIFRITHIYAYMWELTLFFFLLNKFKKKSFDISARVTFVSYKFPSFLWYYSKFFHLGPIGGGECYPINFIKYFPLDTKIKELSRLFLNFVLIFDPLILLTFYKANEIQVVNLSTYNFLLFFKKKFYIEPAITINQNDFVESNYLPPINTKYIDKVINFLYVGRLVHWKGLLFALKALTFIPNNKYNLTVIGNGPDEAYFKKYVFNNNINAKFIDTVERQKLIHFYKSSDYLFLLSLHDSGGMVVKEAQQFNTKVIVSNFGGLNHIVTSKNDFVIKSDNIDDFIYKLVKYLNGLFDDKAI